MKEIAVNQNQKNRFYKRVEHCISQEDVHILKNALLKILLLAIAWSLVINLSCKKQSDEESNISTLPPFNDPIPYSLLGQGKLVFTRIGPLDNAYSGIYVIDVDQQRCWNFDCGVVFAPSVSPDGDRISYMKWGTDHTAWDIYIMDIEGKNQRNITNLVGKENDPSWTFDGSQVFFSRDYPEDNIVGLYRQSPVPNPTDLVQVIDYNSVDPLNFITRWLVSSSSTGKLLVMLNGLSTFDADGSNMQQILPFDENSDHLIYSPAWSPDRSKLAYLSFKRNSDIAVVLLDPGGTNPDTLVSVTAAGDSDC